MTPPEEHRVLESAGNKSFGATPEGRAGAPHSNRPGSVGSLPRTRPSTKHAHAEPVGLHRTVLVEGPDLLGSSSKRTRLTTGSPTTSPASSNTHRVGPFHYARKPSGPRRPAQRHRAHGPPSPRQPAHVRRDRRGLYLSVNTVRSHVKAIYRKLGVSTRVDAVGRVRSALLEEPGRRHRPDKVAIAAGSSADRRAVAGPWHVPRHRGEILSAVSRDARHGPARTRQRPTGDGASTRPVGERCWTVGEGRREDGSNRGANGVICACPSGGESPAG